MRYISLKYWLEISLLLMVLFSIVGCDPIEPVNEIPNPTPFTLVLPEGFPAMPIPEDNPLTVEGIALGKQLFFDPLLSKDGTVSCARCHNPTLAFSDSAITSLGINGQRGKRQSMPLINVGWGQDFFWDGRAESLETQALVPVEDPTEMGENWDNVVQKLKAHPDYPELFERAFKTREITKELVVSAIAQFERTLISASSKYDSVRYGDAIFTPLEQQGADIFFTEKGDCFHCHGIEPLMTDQRFHNNGLDSTPSDLGRFNVTQDPFERGLFKSPTLRNIEFTAPYMHDGRFNTLEEVIQFYTGEIERSPTLDPLMRDGAFIQLTEQEKTALIAFLKTLSDTNFINNPAFRPPPPANR